MNLSLQQEMTRRGFHVEETGGGCNAFFLEGNVGMRFMLVGREVNIPKAYNEPCSFWSQQSNGDTYLVSEHATLSDFLCEFDIANPELVGAL
jgi:hypothetical protein